MKQDREMTESDLVLNSNKINVLKNNKTTYYITTSTYIVNFAESVDKSWLFTIEQGIYKMARLFLMFHDPLYITQME